MTSYGKFQPSKNPLSAFLFFSLMVHAVILLIFFVIQPFVKPKPVIQTISFNLVSDNPAPAVKAANPIPAPAPAPAPQPVKQASSTSMPNTKPTTQPVNRKESLVTRPTPAPVTPPIPQSSPKPTVQQAPKPTVTPPTPVTPAVAQVQQPEVAPQPVAPPPTRTASQVENDNIANQVDSLLATRAKKAEPSPSSSDFLAGGSWIGSPRKTIAFPNIKARIDELENKQGYGYSVTARITFTAQGWVSMVELTRASGDPRIDNIFRNELRKIRIEESRVGSVDTVIKSFVISVQ
ncbi:MAG: hypothetical protein ACRC9L_07100 [Brevinema sp.]